MKLQRPGVTIIGAAATAMLPIAGLIHSETCLPRPPYFIESSGVGQETDCD